MGMGFKKEITKKEWERKNNFGLRFSLSTRVEENRYKIINRLHYTPSKLSKMFPGQSD